MGTTLDKALGIEEEYVENRSIAAEENWDWIPKSLDCDDLHFEATDVHDLNSHSNARKYQLYKCSHGKQELATFRDFMLCIMQDDAFCDLLTQTIREVDMEACYWECIPVSRNTISFIPFEFVLLPAPFLAYRNHSARDFAEYIRTPNTVVTFPNLAGDAQLIVPTTPRTFAEYPTMVHLLSFLRHASPLRTRELWRCAVRSLLQELQRAPLSTVWMSTSGMGVSWLHIRLDYRPKYYNWKPYTCSATQLYEALQLTRAQCPTEYVGDELLQSSIEEEFQPHDEKSDEVQRVSHESYESQSSGPHLVEIPPVLPVSVPSAPRDNAEQCRKIRDETGISSEAEDSASSGDKDALMMKNCWVHCA